ncbi:MAG: glucose dehydrogenase [Chloroflexota bacterium]|nr:MAG: glucose dehydrogenase [Chloroflexota bacterium]
MPDRGTFALPVVVFLCLSVLVASCSTPPTAPPSAPGPSPAASVLPTASGASPAPTGSTNAPTPSPTPAATPAPPFVPEAVSVTLDPVASVAGGPLAFAAPRDGSGRLFVGAKDGRVWILDGGSVSSSALLDIRTLVSTGGEQGLLGLAVHPDFPADPRVFVDYTDTGGDTVVSSFRISAGDPGRLDSGSEQWVLRVAQPYPNHNGGALAFGPDGMLYVSLGDGGSGGDPEGNGQRLDTLLGKVLRLDVSIPAGGPATYRIPPDNPFVNRAGARGEIWLTGLRNPWRMAFDRATGDLWIGDVGQGDWEEIDVARTGASGLNFGWNVMEGAHCFSPARGCPTTGLVGPVTEYGHDLGCTVIGGLVYRGAAQPLVGGYVFADYCSGRMWAIPAAGDGPVAPVRVGTAGSGIVAFGEDAAGEMYAANLDGTIARVIASTR